MFLEGLAAVPREKASWHNQTLLAQVPAFDISNITSGLSPETLNFVDYGHKGVVFRWRAALEDPGITIKIIRGGRLVHRDLLISLFEQAGEKVPRIDINALFKRSGVNKGQDQDMVLRHVGGHVLGNMLEPDYIDPPSAIWVSSQGQELIAVGYSIPFIEGEPVKICEHEDLRRAFERLFNMRYNVYVGNDGRVGNSRNAIVATDGSKKFIDVRLKGETDFNFPAKKNN